MAAGTSVRPELEKGWIVHVGGAAARGGEPLEAVVAEGGESPIIRASRLRLQEGQEVPLSYSTGAARVELTAKVVAARSGEVELELPEEATRIQRRDFARIFVEIPIMLLAQRPNGRAALQRATTIDVSAGGAAIRMSTGLAEGAELPFLLVCDPQLQLTGVASLIGSDRYRRTQFRHRLRFVQLRPADRDALAAWVFRQQMPR
ncbi:MAG: PilZ domain-containing protein [Actinomycetota bacterium]